jgi:hypothetical protein
MRLNPEDQLRQWLAAEREGRREEADLMFVRVFRLVERREPGPRFAESVLSAASVATPAARPGLLAERWGRLVLAIGLILAGAAMTELRLVSLSAHLVSGLGDGLGLAVRVFTWSGSFFNAVLRAWSMVIGVGRGLQTAATSPLVIAVMVASLIVAASAAYALQRLLNPQQELPPC